MTSGCFASSASSSHAGSRAWDCRGVFVSVFCTIECGAGRRWRSLHFLSWGIKSKSSVSLSEKQ